MKKNILNLFFLLLCITSYSQINFEKGYFVTNSGEKKECFIKNKDWKNNPDFIEFKFSEESEPQIIKKEEIKEFSIDNKSKYIRKTIDIDRLVGSEVKLYSGRKTEIKNETVLLKCLVQGNANLYSYTDSSFFTYFFNVNDSEIEQLIFKKTINDNNNIIEFNQYKQQLQNALKCNEITKTDIERLRYNGESLTAFFLKNNSCFTSTEVIDFAAKDKKDWFNLYIRPGVAFQSTNIYNEVLLTAGGDFGNKTSYRIGVELEFFLPFNNSKWAITLEPSFQNFKNEVTNRSLPLTIDYSAIDLPLGLRHYFYLSKDSKIFLNLNYYINFSSGSKIYYGYYSQEYDVNPSNNFGGGIGYAFKNRFSLEYRFSAKRNLLNDYVNWKSDYEFSTIVLGYRLF